VSYRLAARYFSCEFLASNRACFLSCKFLVLVFGASFSYEFLVRLSWALWAQFSVHVSLTNLLVVNTISNFLCKMDDSSDRLTAAAVFAVGNNSEAQ